MLTGIRETELLELIDELRRSVSAADQLAFDLVAAQTQSGLDAAGVVAALREISTDVARIAPHLRWIHEELTTFRVDRLLRAAPRILTSRHRIEQGMVAAGTVADRGVDALWARLVDGQRLGAAPSRDAYASIVDTVGDEVPNPERRAIAMLLIHEGVAPTEAIMRARTATLTGRAAVPGVDFELHAHRALTDFMRREGYGAYSLELLRERGLVDAAERVVPAIVAYAGFAEVSVVEAVRRIVPVILAPPGSVVGMRPQPVFALRTELVNTWLDVIVEAPMNAVEADIALRLVEVATGRSPTLQAALVLKATAPLDLSMTLEEAESAMGLRAQLTPVGVEQLRSDAEAEARGRLNDVASVVDLSAGLREGNALWSAVGVAAQAVITWSMIEAWRAGDNEQLEEMLVDAAVPQIVKLLLLRVAPRLVGPIGVIVTIVMILSSPRNTHETASGSAGPQTGWVNEFGVPVDNGPCMDASGSVRPTIVGSC